MRSGRLGLNGPLGLKRPHRWQSRRLPPVYMLSLDRGIPLCSTSKACTYLPLVSLYLSWCDCCDARVLEGVVVRQRPRKSYCAPSAGLRPRRPRFAVCRGLVLTSRSNLSRCDQQRSYLQVVPQEQLGWKALMSRGRRAARLRRMKTASVTSYRVVVKTAKTLKRLLGNRKHKKRASGRLACACACY